MKDILTIHREGMEHYLRTGTVTKEYMDAVLGDQMESVCAFVPGPGDPGYKPPVKVTSAGQNVSARPRPKFVGEL